MSFEGKDADLTSSVMEHTLENPIQVQYHPPDGQLNFWMFAMIGMGCAFVIFVIGSIYLMCKSQRTTQQTVMRRHPTTTKVTRGERSVVREHI